MAEVAPVVPVDGKGPTSGDPVLPTIPDVKPTSGGYTKEFVDKFLGESKNKSSKIVELQTENDALKASAREKQEADLLENKQHEERADLYKKERDESNAKIAAYEVKEVESKLDDAIVVELKTKYGFNDKYKAMALTTINKKMIRVDEATGVHVGVDLAVKEWHDSNHELGCFGKLAPGVNQNAPQNPGPEQGYAEAIKATKTQAEFDAVRVKFGRLPAE